MKKLFLPIILLVLASVAFLFSFSTKENAKNDTKNSENILANENINAEPQNLVWLTNYKNAVKKAQKEKKRLLLNFTGSDWCGWCVRLDKEVFSKKDFVTYANKNLVCVKLDFPRKKQIPQAEQKQNFELQTKYNVEGYPTILVLDNNEKLLMSTGYEAGGAKNYVQHLENGLKK